MRPLHRTIHSVREASALAPVRPAYAAGIRAAIATMAPIIVGTLVGVGGGTWMSLAGFNGALADKGGPYRTRALTMMALTLASAVTAGLGALGHERLAVAVPVAFVVAFASSLARVWGSAGATVSGPVICTYLISLGFGPGGAEEALARAGWVIVGGLWAMLVALVLWPLRPYRPARVAVSACYGALAAYATAVAARAAAGAERGTYDAWELRDRTAAARAAIEEARVVLATTRRGRPGVSGRGERLVVLHEIADQLLVHLIAIVETLASLPADARPPALRAAVAGVFETMASAARGLAVQIEVERTTHPVPVQWSGEPLRALAAGTPLEGGGDATTGAPDPATRTQLDHAAMLADRAAAYARAASATAATLDDGRRTPAIPGVGEIEEPEPVVPLVVSLGAVLSPDSLVLRYALRVAILTTAAVWLADALGLSHAYWMTITVVIILQPYTGATTMKALQRVLGTVLGGVLTAGLGAVFHQHWAIIGLSTVFVAVCVAMLPVNYAIYSALLTPAFVLLAELSVGDWHLAGVRSLNTVIGGALAVVGARLLWPTPEWSRLPTYMASALRANRDYLRAAVALFDVPLALVGDEGPLREVRRAVGRASANAEESFQRLMGEHRGAPEALAPLITFLTYTRRLSAAVSALALARHAPDAPGAAELRPFAEAAQATLDELAAAVDDRRAPVAFPEFDAAMPAEAARSPLLRARVDRITRALRTLHDAVGQACARPLGR